MKQVLAKDGHVLVQDVPSPLVGPRNVLVRVAWSCVSVGTELAGVRFSGMPLYRRAMKQPENVKKVLDMMREHGIKRTWDRVSGKLSSGTPLGYSAAGIVVSVGSEVEGFRTGERVACAGAGIANHAEVIDVPVNLVTRVPESVDLAAACTVTLGAIALQGVRRAQPTLGETFVVVGLGILGQLTLQILKANGCRVIGVDPDHLRTKTAKANGADFVIEPGEEDPELFGRLTENYGVDGVIITAASESSDIVSAAFQACRKKGRVVLVGDVGLHLRRSDMYAKELDFLISTSYGPGRYDPAYEEGGQDYPLPYVRWTENRNMEAYLRLLASGAVKLEALSQERFSVEQAPQAYEALQREAEKPLMVLLNYPDSSSAYQRKVVLRPIASHEGKIKTAIVGAGNFAQGMHLPNLAHLHNRFDIRCIISRTGTNARAAAQQWHASYATTDLEEVLSDHDVDLVIVATRHHLHAEIALRALQRGKHVLVEKPLALQETELQAIDDFFAGRESAPMLMTGFNRRFSPAIQRTKELLAGRTTPLMVNYRMNAGFITADHWVHGPEGGGRNIGEACHIYDLFGFLTDARPSKVSAHGISPSGKQWRRNDNFVATVEYSDGSVCTLTYTALGDKSYPKERMDVFWDGKVLTLDDYKSLEVAGRRQALWRSMTQRKGQLEELEALAACLREGKPWPISLQEQMATTRLSFEVERRLCVA